MYRKKIRLGIAPTKRGFLSMEEANRQKNRLMNVIRTIQPELVELVDLEDVCENGIAYTAEHAEAAIQKLKKAGLTPCFFNSVILERNRPRRRLLLSCRFRRWCGEQETNEPIRRIQEVGIHNAACLLRQRYLGGMA